MSRVIDAVALKETMQELANQEGWIHVEGFIGILDAMTVDRPNVDYEERKYRHEMEVYRVKSEFHKDQYVEGLKGLIESGTLALKSAILVNGGATIALLTFLGSVLRDGTAQTSLITDISWAMILFVWGTGLAALATGTRYLGNLKLMEQGKSGWVNWFTISLGVISYTLFFWGGMAAFHAFDGVPA